jgi:hypothetical protein
MAVTDVQAYLTDPQQWPQKTLPLVGGKKKPSRKPAKKPVKKTVKKTVKKKAPKKK